MRFRRSAFFAFFIFVIGAFAAAQEQKEKPADFREVVERRLEAGEGEVSREAARKALLEICPIDTDAVARRVFKDYGAMFIASADVIFPPKCIFENEDEVAAFQNSTKSETAEINGREVTLQKAAMKALKDAMKEASERKLSIMPRGNSASRRSYADTLRIWKSRFEPALKSWVGKKKISPRDAATARAMETREQVTRVMEWEAEGFWFSTNFDRSIFSSVAAPGTSQHLSMIALDVAEFANKDVRKILNLHGWFQTIIDDTPHFTYLGLRESELPARGLRPKYRGGFKFWIPNFN